MRATFNKIHRLIERVWCVHVNTETEVAGRHLIVSFFFSTLVSSSCVAKLKLDQADILLVPRGFISTF